MHMYVRVRTGEEDDDGERELHAHGDSCSHVVVVDQLAVGRSTVRTYVSEKEMLITSWPALITIVIVVGRRARGFSETVRIRRFF